MTPLRFKQLSDFLLKIPQEKRRAVFQMTHSEMDAKYKTVRLDRCPGNCPCCGRSWSVWEMLHAPGSLLRSGNSADADLRLLRIGLERHFLGRP